MKYKIGDNVYFYTITYPHGFPEVTFYRGEIIYKEGREDDYVIFADYTPRSTGKSRVHKSIKQLKIAARKEYGSHLKALHHRLKDHVEEVHRDIDAYTGEQK